MVEYVIVLQNVLSYVEIASLNLFLYRSDIFRQHLALDELISLWVTLEARKDANKLVSTEYTHDIILRREHELRKTRISLATRTTAKLIVDTTGFVFFCTDDEESSERVFLDSCSSPELYHSSKSSYSFIDLDIRSSTCHVGRYGDSSILSCCSDDIGFMSVLFCIQDFMRYSLFLKHRGEHLTFCHRHR